MRVDGRFLRSAMAAIAIGVLVGRATPALGVIKITFPVSKLYEESTVVAVGEVTAVSPGDGAACLVREALKGRLPDATFTVYGPPRMAGALTVGQPVVFFGKGDVAFIHAADAWYRAARTPGGGWGITGPFDMVKSFPGRTVGLAAIVREIKAGNKGIQDAIGHEFIGALQDRGNLGVRPTFLTAVDVNGDRDLDLLVGTAGGVRLFLAAGQRYVDVTDRWGLGNATGRSGAAGDVNGDGRPDLLIGRTLWLGGDGRFAPAPATLDLPPEEVWAAAALADVDGDRLTDVVVLTRTGELATAPNAGPRAGAWPVQSTVLWTRGDTALAAVFSQEWGDDGGWYVLVVHPTDIVRYPVGAATAPRSDFSRLTGITLAEYGMIGPMPLQVDLCTPLDYDGNGRLDLLLVTRGGGITLANRGYGAMLINGFMHKQFRATSEVKGGPRVPKLPFELGTSVCVAPGKRAGRTGHGSAQNLLFLRGDGELFEMENAR